MIFDTLVDARMLRDRLGQPDWVVVDCRFRLDDVTAGASAYAAGHIPDARYADLERDLSGPRSRGSGRHPLPDTGRLCETLAAWGITPGTQVVSYDDASGVYAARLWWLLRSLGHRAVAVLDGGLAAWKMLPGEMTQQTPTVAQAVYEPSTPGVWAVDTSWIEQQLAQVGQRWALIDARGASRFEGREEPLDGVAGHIPGAVNLSFSGNLGPDGRFLAPDRLRARFLSILPPGLPPDAVVHMCGSGVSACHNALAMERANLCGSRLYAGSWSAWISDPGHAVAHGT
ncbi:MAG: sulfurtransferase [Acidiferrobacteraceae bacterium]